MIIDRIPFPRPDDPLVAARQRATDARGGNGFLAVSATHAALLLAQGAGRLLRGMDDRGVVAVLDPRLATARYGGFLRASLPPFWTTEDRDTVHAALRRLRAGLSRPTFAALRHRAGCRSRPALWPNYPLGQWRGGAEGGQEAVAEGVHAPDRGLAGRGCQPVGPSTSRRCGPAPPGPA